MHSSATFGSLEYLADRAPSGFAFDPVRPDRHRGRAGGTIVTHDRKERIEPHRDDMIVALNLGGGHLCKMERLRLLM